MRPASPLLHRKMAREELDVSVQRLACVKRKEPKEEFLPPRSINDEELKKFFERNYDRTVARMRKRADEDNNFLKDVVYKADPLLQEHKRPENRTRKEEKWVEKMYTQPLKRKDLSLERLERKFQTPSPVMKKLSPEEQDQVGVRLWKRSMEKKEIAMKAAEQKVYGKPSEPLVLSADQMKSRVQNLYNKSLEDRAGNLQRLTDEYTFKPKPAKKLNPNDVEAIFSRLMETRQ